MGGLGVAEKDMAGKDSRVRSGGLVKSIEMFNFTFKAIRIH
jgi:hypothetical protein